MEDVGAGVGARTDNPVDLLRFVFCHKAARFEPHPCHFMCCCCVAYIQDVWFPAGTKCMARLHHIHHHHGDPERRPS